MWIFLWFLVNGLKLVVEVLWADDIAMCPFYSPFHPFPSKKLYWIWERERSAGVFGDMRTSGHAFEDPVLSVIVRQVQFLNWRKFPEITIPKNVNEVTEHVWMPTERTFEAIPHSDDPMVTSKRRFTETLPDSLQESSECRSESWQGRNCRRWSK